LVLGRYQPWQSLSQSQLFADHRPLFIQAVPYILYASLVMIFSAFILPRAADAKLPLNAFLAFWIAIFIWSIYFMVTNGKLYVQWPRLIPLAFAPDIAGMKRSRRDSLEKGEHKKDVSVSAARGPAGILGALFGRWVPGPGGGEEIELVGLGKEGRAHVE
jgi:hypothetical protein